MKNKDKFAVAKKHGKNRQQKVGGSERERAGKKVKLAIQ